MELLSPAGNIEKLYYAYEYGADAAYIGIPLPMKLLMLSKIIQ